VYYTYKGNGLKYKTYLNKWIFAEFAGTHLAYKDGTDSVFRNVGI